jgi:hypothetical protein
MSSQLKEDGSHWHTCGKNGMIANAILSSCFDCGVVRNVGQMMKKEKRCLPSSTPAGGKNSKTLLK